MNNDMSDIKLVISSVSVPVNDLERAASALDCQIKLLEKSIGEATGRRNAGIAEILKEGRDNDIKSLKVIRDAIEKYHSI